MKKMKQNNLTEEIRVPKEYKLGFKDAISEVIKLLKLQFNKRDKLDCIDVAFLIDKIEELK